MCVWLGAGSVGDEPCTKILSSKECNMVTTGIQG